MTDKIYTLEEIKSIVKPIAESHNIPLVYLFGSYARNEATEKSDIDLCVDARNLPGLFELGGAYADFEDAFGKEIDLITINSLKYNKNERFVRSLNRDKIAVYTL